MDKSAPKGEIQKSSKHCKELSQMQFLFQLCAMILTLAVHVVHVGSQEGGLLWASPNVHRFKLLSIHI